MIMFLSQLKDFVSLYFLPKLLINLPRRSRRPGGVTFSSSVTTIPLEPNRLD